ncbi:double-stranded RNA binding motif domain-containing protein [Sporobolomyces salmoneus]|uniref:double-stranded RNA binding motif domain-containing protein n=1 Tax=Sporobolomyces salmoneus TaxID=183962 RepID=UPI003180AA8C
MMSLFGSNYIGLLNERIQQSRPAPTMEDSYTSVGEAHLKTWTCTLVISSESRRVEFEAEGITKKAAKQAYV